MILDEYCAWCGDTLPRDIDLREFDDERPFCSWNCAATYEAEEDGYDEDDE